MSQEKLERAIRAVIETNHYTEEEQAKFRMFMQDLTDIYNAKITTNESKANKIIEDMERNEVNNNQNNISKSL